MSDGDEVIIVPLDEEKIRDGMSQLGECAQRLAEKHRFCPPVQLQLLDGHGNQLIMFEVNWIPTATPLLVSRKQSGETWKPQPGPDYLLWSQPPKGANGVRSWSSRVKLLRTRVLSS
jgi:hypothetical protein